MKLKIILEIVCKNMKARKKDLWMTSALLVLAVFIFLSGLSLYNAINGIYEEVLLQTNDSRTLIFSGTVEMTKKINTEINSLIETNKIIDGGEYYYTVCGMVKSNNQSVQKNDYSHLLSLTQYNKGYDQSIIEGRGIQTGDIDKIILPKYFSDLSINYMGQYKHNNVEIQNGSHFLGQKITLIFDDALNSEKTYEKTFEVIGVYDNLKEFTDLGEVLVSSKDINVIKTQINLKEASEKNNFYILLDQVQNKNSVIDLLKNNIPNIGYLSTKMDYSDLIIFLTLIKISIGTVTTILMIFTFIYISASTLKNLSLRMTEMGLLKTLGYNPLQIKQLIVFENLLIAGIGCMIAIILHTFAILGVNYFIASKGTIHLKLIIFKVPVIPMLSIVCLIGIIVYGITLRKISKMYSYESITILKSA